MRVVIGAFGWKPHRQSPRYDLAFYPGWKKKREKRTKLHEYCIQLSSSCSGCTLRNALISALSPISAPPETLCFGPPLLLVLCVKQCNHREVSGGRSPLATPRYGRNKSGVKNSSATQFSTPTPPPPTSKTQSWGGNLQW